MALSARLEIRQGQGLVITPQLQQAIKLLQLSNIELEAYVETELEKNPLLQRDERDSAPATAEASDAGTESTFEARAESEVDASQGDLYGDASPASCWPGEASP